MDMHYRRTGCVFHPVEYLDQRRDIVTVPGIEIVQSQCPEKITFGLPVAVAQNFQVLIKTAVILGNGHLVVIDHDNQVRSHFTGIAQTFICLSAAQRAVADHGDDVFGIPFQIPGLGKTAGQANGSGRMSDRKEIVFALQRVGITRNLIVSGWIEERSVTPGQHFVYIALVRNVVHHLIFRRIEHIMQSNRRLDHAEVRADMAAVRTQFGQQGLADFAGQPVQLADGESFYIFRGINFLYIHRYMRLMLLNLFHNAILQLKTPPDGIPITGKITRITVSTYCRHNIRERKRQKREKMLRKLSSPIHFVSIRALYRMKRVHCARPSIETRTATHDQADRKPRFYRILAMLMISANTPAAVTPAPAPYPLICIGYSL